jgi:hypothetical protein
MLQSKLRQAIGGMEADSAQRLFGSALLYIAKVRAGFTPAQRLSVFKQFQGLEIDSMPVQESARCAPRSVGRRTDGRGDGEMPLAQTTADRDD